MKHNHHGNKSILLAILAAILYGISIPLSKVLLQEIPATLMAALLYLGAGFGMLAINLARTLLVGKEPVEAEITRAEFPYVIGMVLLDILAPVLLMVGLTMTNAANASLLNNFEIVATSVIALVVFKEAVGRRMWAAITLITISSILLTVKDFSNLTLSAGSFFVVAACLCWGFENNCTRMLSMKDPLQIVVIKGIGSGFGAMIFAIALGESSHQLLFILAALLLGFVAFGLSIFFYISAQRTLGAARTSAYYAAAPFIGVLISWIFLHEQITTSFLIALIIMILGVSLGMSEHHEHTHLHMETTHEHRHHHQDQHHNHQHSSQVESEHSHIHTHESLEHQHNHTPDLHHRHTHQHP